MSLVAAFLWNKTPAAISTMIFDHKNMKLLQVPRIQYLSKDYLAFKHSAKKIINDFFLQIENLDKIHKEPIILEFKIVFDTTGIPFLVPAKESQFIYKTFVKANRRYQKKIKYLSIKPQLRKRLSGKALKHFKKGLQSLHLVSRKRNRGFEYHLWTVALHATSKNYSQKLTQLRKKLLTKMWNEY